ncbi:unnamed protein product [Allacma fusca]|uniref:Peptidase S1 domain-containing protein n=1 Tax=Allacma fusca TaxID=39272 RepID=A0A8J2L1L8_9HEXA|nr:unnamed protein product [Allacma fusca]
MNHTSNHVQVKSDPSSFGSCLSGSAKRTLFASFGCPNCVIAGYEADVAVVTGDHELYLENGTEQPRFVRKIIVHEDFHSGEYPNDIAIVVLSEPLIFNDAVQALPLPPEGHNATGNALVSGWGHPASLTKVHIPVVPDDECKAAYGDQIDDSNICAGSRRMQGCLWFRYRRSIGC